MVSGRPAVYNLKTGFEGSIDIKNELYTVLYGKKLFLQNIKDFLIWHHKGTES